MNSSFFLGCSCYQKFDEELLHNAGIEWIRTTVPWPYQPDGAGISDEFSKCCKQLISLSEEGFRLCASTPYPHRIPQQAQSGSLKHFLTLYERSCFEMAEQLGDAISMWQISNEPNHPYFREPFDKDEIVRFMQAGGSGIKEHNPQASIGINIASCDEPLGYEIIDRTYGAGSVDFDYAGIDGYFGSWEAGSPETWSEKLDILYDKFKMPVFIQEFGYPSAGDMLSEKQRNSGIPIMELCHGQKKLPYQWKNGFTPEIQAEYLNKVLSIFRSKAFVRGAFYFRFSDCLKCWYCGKPGCPCETVWGLVTCDGKPKPAYQAFRKCV